MSDLKTMLDSDRRERDKIHHCLMVAPTALKPEFRNFDARMMINQNTCKRVLPAVKRPVFVPEVQEIGFCDFCKTSVILELRKSLKVKIQRTVCKCTCRVVIYDLS